MNPLSCGYYKVCITRGERFPFLAPEAQGFYIEEPANHLEAFAAGLEGLALLERMAYETLSQIGAQVRRKYLYYWRRRSI